MSTSTPHLASSGAIEIDSDFHQQDSGLSSDDSSLYLSSTQSLASSIHQHIFENGRRYHTYYGPDKNLLPTDEAEQDRLDLHNEIILRLRDGRLCDAPIATNPHRILDIGTGTGIWAIDMADKYPSAEVLGIDISPIQPSWVPPNCRFEMDDVELEWTHQAGTFDLIHARNIAPSISNWPKVMAEMYRCTKPGGWVELSEFGAELFSDDGTVKPDSPLNVAVQLTKKAMAAIDRPFPVAGTLKKRLEDAGFVDVHERIYRQPIGPWPKDPVLKHTGAMALVMLETGIEAYSLAAWTRILKMDPEDSKAKIKASLKAALDKRVHSYNHFYVAYGRRPDEQD